MSEELIAAAQAELDQANAAVAEIQAEHERLSLASVQAHDARAKADAEHRAALAQANAALLPVDQELERRQGAVRTAQAKLQAAQAGETYTPPETQGVE